MQAMHRDDREYIGELKFYVRKGFALEKYCRAFAVPGDAAISRAVAIATPSVYPPPAFSDESGIDCFSNRERGFHAFSGAFRAEKWA